MFDQLGDVTVRGVIGNPAHRRFVLLPLAACREHEIENRCGSLRIFEEHLVEVAETIEENGVGNLTLDLEVLLEHRGEFHGVRRDYSTGFLSVISDPSRASSSTTMASRSALCGTRSHNTTHRPRSPPSPRPA